MRLDEYVATRFAEHDVHFYHAENLRNFRTYCRARAVLCREELMACDLAGYTRFMSDPQDLKLGALTRVFGNETTPQQADGVSRTTRQYCSAASCGVRP
jgi:hypothetical protein